MLQLERRARSVAASVASTRRLIAQKRLPRQAGQHAEQVRFVTRGQAAAQRREVDRLAIHAQQADLLTFCRAKEGA